MRREKVDVVANKNIINESTCSKNADVIDLGEAIQKNSATLVIEEESKKKNVSELESGQLESTALADIDIQIA